MGNIKQMLANVIRYKTLPLASINDRIETMFINGSLTSEDRAELLEMMHQHATPSAELGDWKTMYEALAVRVNELTARVDELERNANPDEDESSGETEQYKEWIAWDGVNGGYQQGDIVMHNDKIWQSTMNGLNVWEPGAPGVDERYWMCIDEMNSNE